ncbi:MAG: hypothetical protein RLY30_965 [Pseudomonadota bacterium]
MRIRHQQDLFAGILFLVFGSIFFWVGQDYEMGTTRSMGPAFFPNLLSVLQIALGLAVLAAAFFDHDTPAEPLGPSDWRGLLLICGSVILFSQLLPHTGFLIAGVILVLLSSLASHETNWRERILLAVGLTAFCVLIFRVGLEMRFPLIPPALS